MKYRARRFFGKLACRLFGHVEQRIEEPMRLAHGRFAVIVRCDRCRTVLTVDPISEGHHRRIRK